MRLLALGLVFCRPRKNRARQPFSAGGSLGPREHLGTLLVVRTRRENAVGIWWLRPGLLLNVLQCMGQSHNMMIQLQVSAGPRETAVRPGPATCDCQFVRTSDLNASYLSYLIKKTSKSLVFLRVPSPVPWSAVGGFELYFTGDSVLTQKNSCFFLQAHV
ncbi:hypothetical protein mRhiFer1_009898 [Rhinolophus ferrumequinum]|uniref:Uncharacterized protein n=1 Tax=Rhinolophus ferrumequinum TaxID=59479 RepID=A0A7J7YIH1_RHIFE|nr:hypothetical protein mRhiFer1_009898 [Rhinolophus ferrumequinum]